MSEHSESVQVTVRLAHRFFDKLSESEQDHALVALVETGNAAEASAANDLLYLRREQRKAQLTLRALLDGDGQENGS